MNTRHQRSEAAGVALGGLVNIDLSSTMTFQATAVTDTRDFRAVTWQLWVSDKSTATKIRLQVHWSTKATPTLPTVSAPGDFTPQCSEDIETGTGTETDFTAEFDISGKTAPFPLTFSLPVMGTSAALSVACDTGTPHVSSTTAWREG